MHPKVNQEMIDTCREVGVAHVPGVFSRDWIQRITRVIDSVMPGTWRRATRKQPAQRVVLEYVRTS